MNHAKPAHTLPAPGRVSPVLSAHTWTYPNNLCAFSATLAHTRPSRVFFNAPRVLSGCIPTSRASRSASNAPAARPATSLARGVMCAPQADTLRPVAIVYSVQTASTRTASVSAHARPAFQARSAIRITRAALHVARAPTPVTRALYRAQAAKLAHTSPSQAALRA